MPAYGGDDNFSDAPAAPEQPQEKEEASDSPRALLPKSIGMGKDFKPGDEIVLKIEAVHDDEYEVSYATGKGDEGGGSEEPAAPEGGGGDTAMQSMME